MAQSILQTRFWLIGSLLFAAVLEVYPLTVASNLWRPQWMLLAVLFWMHRWPLGVGLNTAFFAGLLLDVVLGGVPGRYALSLCVCAYIVSIVQKGMRHLTVWHSMLLVFTLAWLAGGIVLGIDQLVMGVPVIGRDLLWSALGTAISWLLLQALTSRFAAPDST